MYSYCIYIATLKAEVTEGAFILISLYCFRITTICCENINRADTDTLPAFFNARAPINIYVEFYKFTHNNLRNNAIILSCLLQLLMLKYL